ncbi:MAG: NADH-quinone oxidoreductase subunit NuoN, partial [Betaproteobacteria bacterium]|nr:NADH-quinone oxidoreductase subunit NuoN [Betaproteobacteria bacterium]
VDLGVKTPRRNLSYLLTLGTLAWVAIVSGVQASSGQTLYGFGKMVISEPMGNWLKCFSSLALMATVVYGRPYVADRGMLRGGEFFTLALFSLLGAFLMISGYNFLVLYMGLELMTLSSYAMVALRRDHAVSTEAAMKYFVLGALASGFLLYGLSMIYGATGSLDLAEVFKAIASREIKHQVLVFGLVFVVAGLAFKIGAVPFHMWLPDVYHGAPTAVTLAIGAAPQLAAFAMVVRILVQGLLPLAIDWQQMLGVLAVASLLVGNLAAVAQSNLKRMLAFSTIAQMGFFLLAMLAGVVDGQKVNAQTAYGSAMFYVVTYVLTTLAVFGVIMLLAREGFESEEIGDLAGLNQRSPLYAGIMALGMFSLAGVPPLVGFYAKLSVLDALLSAQGLEYLLLAVFAVLASLIGAFYYLRVVKVMYFDPIPDHVPGRIDADQDVRVVLSLNGALMLLLGLMPGGLMTLCAQSMSSVLKSVVS